MSESSPTASAVALAVDVVPLGGLGEFGLNMMAISCGDTTIVVDAGAMFPEADQLGVDLIVPDLAYLESRKGQVKALVLTHGHEDHIGAVPYVLPHLDGPIYGTPLTLAFVGKKLEEHGLDPKTIEVRPRDVIEIGPFTLEFIRVTHSMPDCVGIAIRTPQGVILHTGDFKVDQTPMDGEAFDLHRFAQLGAEGVLAMFCDSTNIDRRGYTGSEMDVEDGFEEIFTSTEGKIVVATFSSSLYRLQIVADLAAQFNRKVAFVGRGMNENSVIAQRLGHLHLQSGVAIKDSDVPIFPAQDVVCLVTGSQGEANAALSRIAINDHRHVKLVEGDRVVISARAIPGNEKAIGRVLNHIARRGVDVVTESSKHVHVSGHGSEEELKLVLSLVRPKYFVPIHGEFRQLARHAKVAKFVTRGLPTAVEVLTVEDGDVLRFDAEGGRIVDKAPSGRVLIDGTRVGEVDDEVLRDRRHIAIDGIIMPVVAINARTGIIEGVPELVARGFVSDESTADMLIEGARVVATAIAECSVEERTDPGLMKERLRTEVRRFLKKRTGRRPMVLPVVIEI
ncbi:MAG: ribonuclease J [Acidobacteria bacterium]|nr:ribonuclease J [Acidobacteriota bacterium]MSO83641.1 ribonuclease J [Acidobacteriota bacterium]